MGLSVERPENQCYQTAVNIENLVKKTTEKEVTGTTVIVDDICTTFRSDLHL